MKNNTTQKIIFQYLLFKIIFLAIVFFHSVVIPQKAVAGMSRDSQLETIRQDFATLPPNIANNVRVVYDYIVSRNRRQEPLISYVVARVVVDHVIQDRRFANYFTDVGYLSLIMGIMQVESSFNPFAVSHANARGLMQVHIPTWGRYITVEESHEIRKNIQKGTSILYKYFRQTNENLIRALYRYYGAPDPSYAKRVLRAAVNFKRFYKKNITQSPQ